MKQRYGYRGTRQQQRRERAVIVRILDLATYPISYIVATLNGRFDGRPIPAPAGGTWSYQAVDRIIRAEQDEKRKKEEPKDNAEPPRQYLAALDVPKPVDTSGGGCPSGWCLPPVPEWAKSVDVPTYRRRSDDGDAGGIVGWEEEELTEEEARRLMADAEKHFTERKALQKLMRDEGSFRFHDPVWHSDLLEADGGRPRISWLGIAQSFMAVPPDRRSDDEWVCHPFHLGRAGKDTWDREIDALVAEMTRHTGKDVHVLLDRVEGQPGVKGPLRTAVWGILRELAWQRQITLALRQAVVRLSATPPKTDPPPPPVV